MKFRIWIIGLFIAASVGSTHAQNIAQEVLALANKVQAQSNKPNYQYYAYRLLDIYEDIRSDYQLYNLNSERERLANMRRKLRVEPDFLPNKKSIVEVLWYNEIFDNFCPKNPVRTQDVQARSEGTGVVINWRSIEATRLAMLLMTPLQRQNYLGRVDEKTQQDLRDFQSLKEFNLLSELFKPNIETSLGDGVSFETLNKILDYTELSQENKIRINQIKKLIFELKESPQIRKLDQMNK